MERGKAVLAQGESIFTTRTPGPCPCLPPLSRAKLKCMLLRHQEVTAVNFDYIIVGAGAAGCVDNLAPHAHMPHGG